MEMYDERTRRQACALKPVHPCAKTSYMLFEYKAERSGLIPTYALEFHTRCPEWAGCEHVLMYQYGTN